MQFVAIKMLNIDFNLQLINIIALIQLETMQNLNVKRAFLNKRREPKKNSIVLLIFLDVNGARALKCLLQYSAVFFLQL